MFKIAIVGPESTGKTYLASQLADYFGSSWIPEYARAYVERLNRLYTYDDVCNIALKQIEQEQLLESQFVDQLFVFFDTELIITKVWFSYCFDKIPDFLTEHMQVNYFDLYLLCVPDLPWEPDSVREHGSDREFFFDWYKKEIEQTGKPYVVVCGNGRKRIENAIEALKRFEERHKNSNNDI